jgi:ribosomal-protein-alanine N-acetyltransferase
MIAPFLETERLYLKALSSKHLSLEYVRWMNDPEVYRWLESGGNYTLESLQVFLDSIEKNPILFWAIHLKSSEKHIGNIKIDPISARHSHGEYGLLLGDRTAWGQGFAFEASKAVINYCFDGEPQLRKILLGVVRNNKSAVSLYERLGFVTEGIYKSHAFHEGVYCDVLRMAVFNPKFHHEFA